MNEACRLAEKDPDITRAADLAARLGLSPRSLERLVRSHAGLSPKWLIERRGLPMTSFHFASPRASNGGRPFSVFPTTATSTEPCLKSSGASSPFVFLTAATSYILLCLVMVIRGVGFGLSIIPVMTAS